MTILKTNYFDLANLADAAYALLGDGMSPADILQALVDRGFSQTQADQFLSRWSVTTHTPDTESDYSSTLFESDDGFVLAFRGTQGLGDINADVNDIIADGIAIDQVVDIVNEWSRITATGVYQVANVETLEAETLLLQAARINPE